MRCAKFVVRKQWFMASLPRSGGQACPLPHTVGSPLSPLRALLPSFDSATATERKKARCMRCVKFAESSSELLECKVCATGHVPALGGSRHENKIN